MPSNMTLLIHRLYSAFCSCFGNAQILNTSMQTFQAAGQCLTQLVPTQKFHKFHMSHLVSILHIQALGYTSKLFAPPPAQTCLLSASSVHTEKILHSTTLKALSLFLLLKNNILILQVLKA